jgi:hypothetical protein
MPLAPEQVLQRLRAGPGVWNVSSVPGLSDVDYPLRSLVKIAPLVRIANCRKDDKQRMREEARPSAESRH